ncbi:MAG TPA: macro domain-containing protein [Bacteroidetes bacterium]|nr:macro domain-containing protein [Bacteroidota bacterium]HEX05633.1 macro domain-containing protein [Bacteroidota bacterium]
MSENEVITSRLHAVQVEVALVLGDLTVEVVDAIVNAANNHLAHGGGVAGAICRRGGPSIQRESYTRAPVPVGEATWTSAGDLNAKYVIHAVGPRWGEGDEDEKLANAVQSSLDIANRPDLEIKTVSMPAISTGIFGFPLKRAAEVILSAIHDWLNSHPDTQLKIIRLCLFDRQTLNTFDSLLDDCFGD